MQSRNEANLPACKCALSELLAEVKRTHLTREKNINGILIYQKFEEKTFKGFTGMK